MAKRWNFNAYASCPFIIHLLHCIRSLVSTPKYSTEGYQIFPREKWGAFQDGGRVNHVIRYCIGNHNDRNETKRFEQVRQNDGSYLSRRLRFLLVLASACPLVGLLGTVGGMLRTFDGLSMQGSYKMDIIASGISEALVTTQAGLLIAIPALAFFSST